jgi:hypothetical protein
MSLEDGCQVNCGATFNMVGALQQHMVVSSSSSSSSPVLSADALQLSADLLLRAGVEWQRQYMLLPEEQQLLLQARGVGWTHDEASDALQEARRRMHHAHKLLVACCDLLQKQMNQLWTSGQWQPQMQLLQQSGGQVLLQALPLAVHCSS